MTKKGYKQTDEHKRKIGLKNSISLKGHKLNSNQAKALEDGRKLAYTPESIKKRVDTRNKRGIPWMTEATKEKIIIGLKKAFPNGRPLNSGNFKKGDNSGEKCHLWKGGITPINKAIRDSIEYKLWHNAVFERDEYTCIWCGKHGGTLHSDHIKPFALFPELRFAIDNGRTLCKTCHNLRHSKSLLGE